MMIYDVAKELGNRVLKTIEPLIIRGEIAGSIRRKKSEVHDVDIVVIPKPVDIVRLTPTQTLLNTFGTHMIENKLTEKLGAKVIKHGPKLLVVTIGGNQVDIYAATEDDWGIQLLRWTGSMEHNIWLCNRAITRGMKLAVSHGLEKDGKVIASRTEEDIFKALGLPWIEPTEREK